MKTGLLIALLFAATFVHAQSNDEKTVAAAVERLNKALVAADSVTLMQLTAAELSYGHSNGKLEDRPTFVHNAVSGAFKFQSIDATGQTITLAGNNAVVRHQFAGKAINNGAPADINISVLQVWQKQKGGWKLLARQGYKF